MSQKRKGFTLIELLVVIAIIALLLAVVMPARSKAKDMARDLLCRTNLKSMQLATILYTEAQDGKMPEYVAEDALIKPTKTRPAKAISYYSKRTQKDFEIFFARFKQSMKVIKSGLFLPANPWGFDSPCNYCGFAIDGSCKYFNTKRIYGDEKPVVVKKDSVEEGKNILGSLMETLKNEKD